jgi:hypothetical protein
MLFVVGGRLREVHFPKILENGDWNEIKILSGLRDVARSEICDSIGYCRELQLDSKKSMGNSGTMLWQH